MSMINIKKDYFQLDTKDTSYVFRMTKYGDLEHLYYGAKIPFCDASALPLKRNALLINTLYPEGDVQYGIDSMTFEYSFPMRGDAKSPAAILNDSSGMVFDFTFLSAEASRHAPFIMKAHSKEADSVLKVTLKDATRNIFCNLYYLVFENANVITRFTEIVNCDTETVTILKLSSAQLDLNIGAENSLLTFQGAWGREQQKVSSRLSAGMVKEGSRSGLSSAEVNPFFVYQKGANTNCCGDAYGFNLIYSASHEYSVEHSPYSTARILNGVQSDGFVQLVKSGEKFQSPESVLTFSENGASGVSQNMHNFVKAHILKKQYKIPVMVNSWEATYFDVSEEKIKRFIDATKEVGAEAVIIDDGWFGARNDDTTSLGDFYENRKKFPSGLKSLSNYAHEKGIRFGIWLEPEMISVESDLYRAHPEWAVKDNAIRQIVGRGQYILDLTNPDVRAFIKQTIDRTVNEYGADYIKWDFNRRFAEVPLGTCSNYYFHYINGLYEILDYAVNQYPDLIIEGCASGGGRFDLGILCFCPIIWTSDNTDPTSRMKIQTGTSYGYPASVMVNHVAMSPSHQTKRCFSLETAFDIAKFGTLGLQLDVSILGEAQNETLKRGILQYKNMRELVKDGAFLRLTSSDIENHTVWQLVSKDREEASVLVFKKRYETGQNPIFIKVKSLIENEKYLVKWQGETTIFAAEGATLMRAGFPVYQDFDGLKPEIGSGLLTDSSVAVYQIIMEDRQHDET